MIDWTYVHFRVLMRILAPKALLYTEMQTTGAIEHNAAHAFESHPSEHPLALQIGGSNKEALVRCAQQAEDAGFCEINLNLGCPSDRVQAGRFGACLMLEPDLVAECISAMKYAVSIPVTTKVRIGVDEYDSFDFFSKFARTLIEAGSDKLIVHARKAWLNGLSPKQNRTIPPVNYEYVYRLKQDCKNLPIVINGNILTIEETQSHLNYVDGVMIGRLACQNPYQIAQMHHQIYPEIKLLSRKEVFRLYLDYLASQRFSKVSLGHIIKPILNLTHGLPGAKTWREQLVHIQRKGLITDLNQLISYNF